MAGRTLLMCEECRHLSWEEMPTEAELTAFYSSDYTGSHDQNKLQSSHIDYYRSHAAELAGLVGRPLAEMVIADIGCSIPVFLEQTAASGCRETIGVDWSEEARAYGEERGIRVVTPDAFLAEVPDASLDVLRYSHVLEHLTDPLAVLRAQVSKLRPGGLLYVTQPNLPMLRVGEVPAPFDNTYPTHLQFFTPASLIRLVEAVGCGVERFFTVSDPDHHAIRHGPWFDLEASLAGAAVTARRGQPARGLINNFPFHFGRNSALYARAGLMAAAPTAPAPGGDALARLLAGCCGAAALAYVVGDGNAGALLQAGFARVVTFGPPGLAAVPGLEHTGRVAGARSVTIIPGSPSVRREIETITLDDFAQADVALPRLIWTSGADARTVLSGAAGLIERTRPVLVFQMTDVDVPFSRLLLAERYDLLRIADWTPVLAPGAGPLEGCMTVLGLPKV